VQPHAGETLGKRAHANVLGEDELLEPLDRRVDGLGGNVEQDHAARFQHVHIRVHAPLRRQPRGVAARPLSQCLNVVGKEALQIGCAVLPGNRDL